MTPSFDQILSVVRNGAGVLMLASLAYLLFVLHRRHGNGWSRVACWGGLLAMSADCLSAAVGTAMLYWTQVHRVLPASWDTVETIRLTLNWAFYALALVSGGAFLGLAIKARIDRQVAKRGGDG